MLLERLRLITYVLMIATLLLVDLLVALIVFALWMTTDAEAKEYSITPQQFDLVVRVAAGEARGEDDDMAISAVCHVMLNRLFIGAWGSHVDQVVSADRQFSALNLDDPNRALITSPGFERTRSYKRVRSICRTTFRGRLGGYFIDITGGADHYHSGKTIPYWACVAGQWDRASKRCNLPRTPSARIGSFTFYDLRQTSPTEIALNPIARADGVAVSGVVREALERASAKATTVRGQLGAFAGRFNINQE